MTLVHGTLLRLSALFWILFLLQACGTKDRSPADLKKYSIYAMLKDGSQYIVDTDSLTSGSLEPKTEGALVAVEPLYYELVVRDGNYYSVNHKAGTFNRYAFRDGKFVTDVAIPLKGITSIDNYNWISPDSLLLLGFDDEEKLVRYAKIAVKSMTSIEGIVPIPKPSGKYNWLSTGFSLFKDGKLFVGYAYHSASLQGYTTGDTMYTEVIRYPQMVSEGRLKDTRSAYPGGVNTRQSHYFTDEKGDFYFISCPGIGLGNAPEKPTAIFRIKKDESVIDPDYFFNISASLIGNHGYGFWYIGNGKAIVRTERKGIFSGMNDHWKVPHFDFYVVDLATQQVNRLGLPLDKGTARRCVLVENGTVYITINSDREGSDVWLYNPASGSLKKGLHFAGDIDYILRLEPLH